MADTKKIILQLLEEPWKGNWDVIDEYVAPGYVGHDPAEPGPIRGPDGFKANIQKYIDGFADAHITVDDQIAEGDKVVTRLRGRATFTGEILGIPPNGKVVEITGISIHRIADGKLVEHWANADLLSFMQQLGALPAPEQAPA